MADYTLRYSGAEIDSICDKVTDMSFSAAAINNFFVNKDKLRIGWGTRVLEGKISKGVTRYSTVSFGNIFPEELKDREDPLVIVGSDYGNLDFSDTGIYYKKEGRTVNCTVRYRSDFDNETQYKITVYCLVIFTTDGVQCIE